MFHLKLTRIKMIIKNNSFNKYNIFTSYYPIEDIPN